MSDSKAIPGRPVLDCFLEVFYSPRGDKSEDAFAYSFEKTSIHSQAVFDGCGGSGSWKYAEFKNATGALVAAQSIAREYLAWLNSLTPEQLPDPERVGESFHAMADKTLSGLKNSCAPMKVSGSLVKAFPCTASAAIMTGDENDLYLTTMNAGDSRVYFLTPQTGLVQLTNDDSAGNPDPMESLRESAPMTEMLNADKPYTIKTRRLKLACPCAILCATDGVFSYVRSPMDFEYLLLDALMNSDSFALYEEKLKERIGKITGDDCACVISFYGWGSFENTRKKLKSRYDGLKSIVASLDAAMETGTLDRELERIWAEYKTQTVFDEMQG